MNSKISDNNFYQISGWMINRLKLKGIDLHIFAIIYGFSQNTETEFHGSLKYLQDFTNTSKSTVISALNKLTEKKFVIKREEYLGIIKHNYYSVNFEKINELLNECGPSQETRPAENIGNYIPSQETRPSPSQETRPNNYNINIDNISTIKSDKSNLMLDTGSDEPSDVSYKQNEFNHNENSMGMSCYEEENKQTKTAHAGEDASDVSAGDSSMPETVDTTKEQSELDKLNAIKQFKGTPKPAKPKSTTSPFKKCLKMIYDANYSDEVKSALVEFLKSLSQYRHITESAFELILNNLEKSIEECPYPNDEGLMNFLRLRVVKGSHAKGYRDFYKIKPYELTQWVSEFRGTSISVERKFNDDAKSVVYDPNNPDHQLATNPDGTPMIF